MAALIQATFVLFAFVTIAGCANQRTLPEVPKDVRAFLGDRIVAVLRDPQKVEVSRVQKAQSGLEVTATAPEQDARFGRSFARIFLSDEAYQFNAAKACMFRPDTLVRVFGPNGDRAEFVLCFTCEEFKVTGFDASGKPFDQNMRYQDFAGVTGRLKLLIDGVIPPSP
jgi:hypothetical protein